MNLTDNEIQERLSLAGFHGATPEEIGNVRKDATLLSDIEQYGRGGFNLADFPSKDTRSPEEKLRDLMPKNYHGVHSYVSKKSDADRKKRLAAKAARKLSRKKR